MHMPYLKTATEELKRLILWSAAGWYQKHIRKRTNGRIPEWDSAETYFGMAVIESLRWFLYQKSGCHTYTRNSLWSNWGEIIKVPPVLVERQSYGGERCCNNRRNYWKYPSGQRSFCPCYLLFVRHKEYCYKVSTDPKLFR